MATFNMLKKIKNNRYKPSYLNIDKNRYHWKPDIDYRQNPELYKVGKRERAC